jgi:hypothetical protein
VDDLMRRITNTKRLAKAVKGISFVHMKKGYDVPQQIIPENE